MSLKNLVGVSPDTITPSRETAQRLIAAAARQIADAKIKAVSGETRFSSAYTAIRIDYLRKQRNVAEYSGDLVSDADVAECVRQAEALRSAALAWLKRNKKELM
jgi:hypothetical protein